MDATTGAVTTAVVVTVGRWVQGQGLEARVVIGGGIYAIFLSIIQQSQPVFASRIALLVLVTALLLYMVPIAKKMGFTNNGKTPPVQGLAPMQRMQ